MPWGESLCILPWQHPLSSEGLSQFMPWHLTLAGHWPLGHSESSCAAAGILSVWPLCPHHQHGTCHGNVMDWLDT